MKKANPPLLLASRVAARTVAQESSRVELCSARALDSSGDAAKDVDISATAVAQHKQSTRPPHSSRCLAMAVRHRWFTT